MKFEEVLPALRAGKSIRRNSWTDNYFIKIDYGSFLIQEDGTEVDKIMAYQLLETDWEIYEEKEVLNPCPFCGSPQVHLQKEFGLNQAVVVCNVCSARSHCFLNREDAISAWNRRA